MFRPKGGIAMSFPFSKLNEKLSARVLLSTKGAPGVRRACNPLVKFVRLRGSDTAKPLVPKSSDAMSPVVDIVKTRGPSRIDSNDVLWYVAPLGPP